MLCYYYALSQQYLQNTFEMTNKSKENKSKKYSLLKDIFISFICYTSNLRPKTIIAHLDNVLCKYSDVPKCL